MPDDEKMANDNMSKSIDDALSDFDDDADDSDDSQDDSDDSTTDSNADSADDSDDSDDSQDDSDDSDDTEDEEDDDDDSDDKADDDSDDVDFSLRDTPTSIKNFVAKLKEMSPEKRQEKIDSLDPVRNKSELKAIEGLFTTDTDKQEKFTVSKDEWENVQKQLAQFKDLDKVKEVKKLYESLAKDKPKLETELTNRMLEEKYGKRFKEVSKDPKFEAAMKQYEKLELTDRIAASSMHSKAAREILIEKAATSQNKLKALKGKKASSSKNSSKGKYKHNIMTPEGVEERFGDELAAVVD